MKLRFLFHKPKDHVAVIVPVYKEVFTRHESMSFKRCLKVLGNHPIFLIAPDGLSLQDSSFRDECPIIYFPKDYFKGIREYNRLMFSGEFYRRFLEFQYILIYQLDSFVFSDQLLYWCRSNYDYIGAPWLGLDRREEVRGLLPIWERKSLFRNILRRDISNVGNGGFSLRRVRTFLLFSQILSRKAMTWPRNEDIFWSFVLPCYYPLFRKPSAELALRFAFELNPRQAFELTGKELPFGCHAWGKYDFDFWKEKIEELGYEL